MNRLKNTHLILYFTYATSLVDWNKTGVLEREISLYTEMLSSLGKITFITYGQKNDFDYIDQLGGINLICNRWGVPLWFYELWIKYILPYFWKKPWVVKSNQILGADMALMAMSTGGGKLIVRCGYLHANFIEREYGVDAPEAVTARELESRVFHSAHRIILTTKQMENEIVQKYEIQREKIHILPNYVLIDLFKPAQNTINNKRSKIGFIGRLEEQKNLFSLLDAIEGLNVDVLIVGDGSQRDNLKKQIELRNLPVILTGNLPHRRIPQFLQSCDIFVLPSLYEGHPKALIEAMSCGLPVIGTRVQGTEHVISDRGNGLLCDISAKGIRVVLEQLLEDEGLRVKIGSAARNFVVENYALKKIASKELALIEELLND